MITTITTKVNGSSDINLATLVERTENECNNLKNQGHRIISVNFIGNRSVIFAENDEPSQPVDNFDVFEDRVMSLLARWRKFKQTSITDRSKEAIKNCMQEICDGFTDHLMK